MFCPAENGHQEHWGMSPEGIEAMRENHIKKHCFMCPTCHQPIKVTNVENIEGYNMSKMKSLWDKIPDA